MASLKVFVSSTCFDLAVVRSQLRIFLEEQGHLPIMSDYNDVLYDPRVHTHTSCVDEVAGCDAVVLIIGGRFGGKAIPQANASIDFDHIKLESNNSEFLQDFKDISVTQLEALKAINKSIPVFAFVDERVWNDHATYEKNKTKEIADEIEYASIEKPSTAKYIFEFINFLRQRASNNSITAFAKYQDIEDTLRKQWSGLLQRLLLEQRTKIVEARRIDELTEQFEDLKAAILSGMGESSQREIARGVIKFRSLFDFLAGLNTNTKFSLSIYTRASISWKDFLSKFDIKQFIEVPREFARDISQSGPRITGILIKNDETIFVVYFPIRADVIEEDFNSFMLLPEATRKIIFETLEETRPRMLSRYVRHEAKSIDVFLHELQNPRETEIVQKEIQLANEEVQLETGKKNKPISKRN